MGEPSSLWRSSRSPRVIAAWTHSMLLAAERAGLDAKELLQHAGLSAEDLEDRDSPIEFEQHLRLAQEIIRRLPGVSMGLRTGMTATPARFGVLGYVLRHASVLRRALFDYIRFQRLVTDVAVWSVELGPLSRITLALHPRLGPFPSATEVHLATLIALSRHLTGVHIVPAQVAVCHLPQSNAAEHEQFFGCRVHFGADRNEICLDTKLLELPIKSADELSYRYFLSSAEAVLTRATGLKQTSETVRQYVVKNLQHGPPRRNEVAHAMGKTARTLLRYLEQEGQTFEGIVDSSRRELALAYISDSRLAIFEIAGLLGYTEPSAFFRAFRRWTGVSPQQHRRQTSVTV